MNDAALRCYDSRLCSIVYIELHKNLLYVALDRLFADMENAGDLLVAQAVCQQFEYLGLALGQT